MGIVDTTQVGPFPFLPSTGDGPVSFVTTLRISWVSVNHAYTEWAV